MQEVTDGNAAKNVEPLIRCTSFSLTLRQTIPMRIISGQVTTHCANLQVLALTHRPKPPASNQRYTLSSRRRHPTFRSRVGDEKTLQNSRSYEASGGGGGGRTQPPTERAIKRAAKRRRGIPKTRCKQIISATVRTRRTELDRATERCGR